MDEQDDAVRVVHVDDDPDFLELSSTFLAETDDRFVVETATSAEEALSTLSPSVDCVVSDYDMPKTDGIAFLKQVRAEYPDLPFILFTGQGSEAVASDAIAAGATDYLRKRTGPEQYELLANRVGNAVEQSRSERRLRTTAARLEALFENSPDMINVHDAEGNLIDPNPRFCERTGYDRDELTGMKVWEVDEGLDPQQARELWAGMETGDRRTLTGRYRRRDGSTFPVEVHVRRLALKGEDRFLVISRDITERERQRQERMQYEQMVDAMWEAACVYDADGRFVVVNDYLADFYRATRADLEGRQSPLVERLRDGEDDPWQRLVDGDREVVTGEIENVFPNRGRETLRYRLSRLVVDGEFQGVVGIAREVTDRGTDERTQTVGELRDGIGRTGLESDGGTSRDAWSPEEGWADESGRGSEGSQ